MGGVGHCLLLLLLSLICRRDQTLEFLDKSINHSFILSVRSHLPDRTKRADTYSLPIATQVDHPLYRLLIQIPRARKRVGVEFGLGIGDI